MHTDRNNRLTLAVVGTVAVSLAAVAGSARELYGIGVDIGYGWPAAIPLALDGLAVVATALVTLRRDRHALVALVASGVLSGALQVGAVLLPLLDPASPAARWADAGISVTVHVAVLGAAIAAIHLIARVTATTEDVPAETPPAVAPVAAPQAPSPRVVPRGASLDDLVARARAEDAPRTIRGLKAHLAVGDTKARAVLDALTSGDAPGDARTLELAS